MGFRTTTKCPQKAKKKVWIVLYYKALSEITIKQSSPEHKIAIYYATENNLVLDLDLKLFN